MNNPTETEPIYKIGQHIQNNEGVHGIIHDVDTNFWGWVYCIERKDWIGLACINEGEASSYEPKS